MSWLDKLSFGALSKGMSKSARSLGEGLKLALTGRQLDEATCEALEDALIATDIGTTTATELVDELRSRKFGQDITEDEVRTLLADNITKRLEGADKPLTLPQAKPVIMLVVGVNGAGKTTTIGKLAQKLNRDGKSVILAAGDTFRAAAVEQLAEWGRRAGVPVVTPEKDGADPASLIYRACQQAQEDGADIVIADTAGRLQNRQDLMAQLEKIIRVIRKFDPDAPHTTLLVLDATVGQNAHQQVEIFKQMANVTGLVVTKLDGTAKAGVVVSLARKFGLPIHFLGVGEGVEDLRPFNAKDFAQSLVGTPQE